MAGNYNKNEQRFLKQLGRAIRDRRIAQNLSQEKLAELTGLHRTYVGSVERGERNVSALNLQELAAKLECSASDFFLAVERVNDRPEVD